MAPGRVVPVDSEHSAIAQCLASGTHDEVRRLVLTASGGAFRGRSRDELRARDARGGARPPHVGHGPDGHDEHRDAREQGARGHRGAPAVRRALRRASRSSCTRSRSCTRWSSSSTARRSRRRRRRTCACRSRSASTGPHRVPGVGVPIDWTVAQPGPSSRSTRTRSRPSRSRRSSGAAGGTRPAVFNAANEQAVHAFHAGRLAFLDIVPRHRGRARDRARALRRARPRRRCSRRTGRARAAADAVIAAPEHWRFIAQRRRVARSDRRGDVPCPP